MRAGEPLLLICHAFPPVFDIGGRRWAKFAKELARRGHPVHVIRAAHEPGTPVSLWDGDGSTAGIVHHPLPRRYPAVLTHQQVSSLADKLAYHIWARLLPVITQGNWYDHAIFWRKPMVETAAQLIKNHGIRQVVVTGFPFRTMVYALDLKRKFPQVRLTMDFRDEWTTAGHYGLASMPPARIAQEKDFEERVINKADNVISPAANLLGHLRHLCHSTSVRFVHIPHAVDPDDFDLAAITESDCRFKMIYAGSMYGESEAKTYFTEVLGAVQALRDSRPEAFGNFRFDLYITGHDTTWYEREVAARGWQDRIVFHKPVSPREAFQHMKGSNLVMLFIPAVNKDILGTKFQEIFYIGTPILHVGEPGLVSRTIVDRRMGDSLRVADLASELPRIISGERKVDCDRNADHRAYLLQHVTDRLLAEVLN